MIFQYLDPFELLHIRLVSTTFEAIAVPIIREKLFYNSMIRVYPNMCSRRSYCKPIDSLTDNSTCEWVDKVLFSDVKRKTGYTLEVVPSKRWAWYQPCKREQLAMGWERYELGPIRGHPTEFIPLYGGVNQKDYQLCVYDERLIGNLKDLKENYEDDIKKSLSIVITSKQIPWTFTYTKRDLDYTAVQSVKIPLWALVKIWGMYIDRHKRWIWWQPKNLNSKTVAEAEYYLDYFRRTRVSGSVDNWVCESLSF